MKELTKNILSALAVAFFGFILLNLTFIFDAAYQGIVRWCIGLFVPLDPNMHWYWFPPVMHGSFVVIIGLISWLIFKSKLGTVYKAIFMTVPVATVLVTVGILFYQWPIIVYSLCSLLCAGILYYFYRIKQPWLYYYAVILVGITLLIMGILGVDI